MRIKNWDKFQHFRDRRPPWIKLYRELLDQRDINMISDWAFRVLINLWLLASEDETKTGQITNDLDEIAFRLRTTREKIESALQELTPWINLSGLSIDFKVISERYQSDAPETETKGETETKTEKKNPTRVSKRFKKPSVQNIKDYCLIRQNGIDAEEFYSFYESKGWMIGKNKMKDWKAAVITWEKSRKKNNSGKKAKSDQVHDELWGEENDHAVAQDLDNQKHRVIDVTPS